MLRLQAGAPGFLKLFLCRHLYVCVCVCVYVCVCVRACMHAWVHAYVGTCVCMWQITFLQYTCDLVVYIKSLEQTVFIYKHGKNSNKSNN